jgi:hypothetical protein
MSNRTNKLRFPSGRVRAVVASRHALARKIVTSTTGDWVKIDPNEEGAANSLISWGMVERHHQTPQYVRWSPLHERPVFGRQRRVVTVYGKKVGHISQEQSMVLTLTEGATYKKGHEVLVINDAKMQRMLRALERRGLIDIERRTRVWVLKIAASWRAPMPSVPTGTGVQT